MGPSIFPSVSSRINPDLDLLFVTISVCVRGQNVFDQGFCFIFIKSKMHSSIGKICIIFYIWALWSKFNWYQIFNCLCFNL